jgi:hypothetical protein
MANIDRWLAMHENVDIDIDPYPFKRTHTSLVATYGDEKVNIDFALSSGLFQRSFSMPHLLRSSHCEIYQIT